MTSNSPIRTGLRTKGLLVVLLLLVSASFISDRTLTESMRSSYEQFEQDALHSDILRLSDAMEQQLVKLNEVTREWGYWTEMAEYTQTLSADFREANISQESLQTSKFEGMAIFSSSGQLLDHVTQDTQYGALFQEIIQANSPILHVLLADPDTSNSICGLTRNEEARLMVCHHPIKDTKAESPVRGSILVARAFDHKLMAEIARQTRLNLNISNKLSPSAGRGGEQALQLEHLSTIVSKAQLLKKDPGTLIASITLKDLHGQDVSEIQMTWPRTLSIKGDSFLAEVRERMAWLNVISLLIVLLMLDRMITSPLLALRRLITSISNERSWSRRLPAKRTDEIGDVARSTNVMLDVLEKQLDILEALSNTNELTGLPNRRAFDLRLQTALALAKRSGRPLALLLLDLDRFKQYNDLLGHVEGDRALQIFADCLRESVHRPTDFAARYGGEEFVVLLEETPEEGAVLCAETILYNLRQREVRHPGNPPLHVLTASAGIAMASPNDTPESLLRRADAALYKSKDQGRDRATLAPAVQE